MFLNISKNEQDHAVLYENGKQFPADKGIKTDFFASFGQNALFTGKKDFSMKMPLLFISTLILLVSGCVGSPAPADGQKTIYVCQGSGCSQNSATFPSRAETHKPTKDEKI